MFCEGAVWARRLFGAFWCESICRRWAVEFEIFALKLELPCEMSRGE